MRWTFLLLLAGLSGVASAAEPADLRTRKSGSDWPKFLGPTNDGVSSEKGILSPWPEKGLKVVWQTKLGLGYSPPTTSRGRVFLFDAYPAADRKSSVARLSCRNSETGIELWKFEYPTAP